MVHLVRKTNDLSLHLTCLIHDIQLLTLSGWYWRARALYDLLISSVGLKETDDHGYSMNRKHSFAHLLMTTAILQSSQLKHSHRHLTIFLKTFYNCIVPMGFLKLEIQVASPGESQLRQSHATPPRVHAVHFSVSVIHQTLTWTTGSLTYAQM